MVGSGGALGGALLVILNETVASGKLILLPYALLVLMVALMVWNEAVPSFRERFGIVLATFFVSSLFLYVAIAVSPGSSSLSAPGHFRRLLAIAGIGALVALPVARVTENRRVVTHP